MGLVAEEKKLLLFTIWITIRSNIFPHPSYIIYPSMERFLALPQSLPPPKKNFFVGSSLSLGSNVKAVPYTDYLQEKLEFIFM